MIRPVTPLCCALALVALAAAPAAAQTPAHDTGILLLAHGGAPAWNENVRAIAASVDKTMPVEVAFGMATRANIQLAIDRLTERGAARIVAVPLFVSSHSSVITSTAYLLGLRKEMPADLVRFARMSHGDAGGDHAHHADPAVDGTKPVTSRVPITMTGALDSHPYVGAIVRARAAAMSRMPAGEAVVLVAHGPVDDESNERWLMDLRRVASALNRDAGFRSVDVMTVRDDAPARIRDQATSELREIVERRGKHSRVLVVPVLLSYGGIEAGIRKRLEGLAYVMSDRALAPDDRLVAWVLEMARTPPTR